MERPHLPSTRLGSDKHQDAGLSKSDVQAQLVAMSEIMKAISTSRHDEAPIFSAILENAKTLCNAPMAALVLATAQDEHQTLAAHVGINPKAVELFESGQMKMDPTLSYAAKCIVDGELIAWPDMGESDLYHAGSPIVRSMVDESGIRSVLFVPLIKNGAAIGLITLFRSAFDPFSANEITLVKAFAAQAVIAIDNTLQFREAQARLEREAATKEILSIINSSLDDETPVFQAILVQAERLCGADGSGLQLLNDAGTQMYVAAIGTWDSKNSFPIGAAFAINTGLGMCIAVREARIVQYEDLKETEVYKQGHEAQRKLVDDEGVRTHLNVPLLKNGVGFGNITLARKEPKAFSPDEIALVETFAAQAVIAIENVRQFRALQTQLEREAATGEILSVISQSREDDAKVFDSVLEQAAHVCGADQAALLMVTPSGTHGRLMANWGHENTNTDPGTQWPMESDLTAFVAIRKNEIVRVNDYKDTDLYRRGDPTAVEMVEVEKIRSRICVPMQQNGKAIGAILLSRREVRPFTPADINLIESFAQHAVIAIENTQQFAATQDALARQTATSDILRVINGSLADTQPVFDAIVKTASEISKASYCLLLRVDQGMSYFCASHGYAKEELEQGDVRTPLPLNDDTIAGCIALKGHSSLLSANGGGKTGAAQCHGSSPICLPRQRMRPYRG